MVKVEDFSKSLKENKEDNQEFLDQLKSNPTSETLNKLIKNFIAELIDQKEQSKKYLKKLSKLFQVISYDLKEIKLLKKELLNLLDDSIDVLTSA